MMHVFMHILLASPIIFSLFTVGVYACIKVTILSRINQAVALATHN